MTVGALYQISEFGVAAKNQKASPLSEGKVGDKKENTLIVSGEMKTATPWTAYGQATLIKNVAGNDGDESVGVGIGGKYAFNKATTGHVYTGYVNSERKMSSMRAVMKHIKMHTKIQSLMVIRTVALVSAQV